MPACGEFLIVTMHLHGMVVEIKASTLDAASGTPLMVMHSHTELLIDVL